jgi:peptidoglycan-associated lipoprotein
MNEEASVKRILLPLLLVGLLSGCETLGLGDDDKAAIEDRNAAEAAKKPAAGTTAGTASKGAQTAGLSGGAVSGQSLDGKALDQAGKDPRKDPASPLSKRSIYFDFDSFVVKDEYRPVIEAHAAYLARKSDSRIVIQGNADERGSREYNLALGQKRAESVRKAFAILGVKEAQIEAVSFGEEKPRRAGATEEDYAENRRADIVYGDE